MLLYPDIIQHSNSNNALVDSDFIRGGIRTVLTAANLYTLPADQLKQFVTKVYVSNDTGTPANNGWWTLIGSNPASTNLTDGSGWSKDNSLYSLPTASTSILGGVKIDGTSIVINTGVISLNLPSISANLLPKVNSSTNGLISSSISDNGTNVTVGSNITLVISSGNISTSGTITATGGGFDSDISIKKDIIYEPFIANIENIKAVSYRLKSTDEFHYGYIAQDVEKVLPSAIIKKASGLLAVQYHEVLVAKVNYLENRLAYLTKLLEKNNLI